MKRYLSFFLFLLLSAMAWAQSSISVADFYLAPNDQTANTHGTMRLDQNGETCALIKVETTHMAIIHCTAIRKCW